MSDFEAAVIGAGQAGLSASHELDKRNVDHVVLERALAPGGRWRNRWQSFCLVTINENCRLPGFPYDGDNPDGFMPRDAIVAYLGRYADHLDAPVEYATEVLAIEPRSGSDSWLLSTSSGDLTAATVIVAAGPFQKPKLPTWAERLPAQLTQLHSAHYESPDTLVPGAVLVVGSGQSGAQIAEELREAGRQVYLGVSRCGRAPRRYRGRDITGWGALMRQHAVERETLRTVGDLESPRDRFGCNPHLSGKNGGHEINLRQLALDGLTLLGRPAGVRDTTLTLDDDLFANLDHADAAAARSRRSIDQFIDTCGIDAPEEPLVEPLLPNPPARPELDLHSARITSVIWATGYHLDFLLDHCSRPLRRVRLSPA